MPLHTELNLSKQRRFSQVQPLRRRFCALTLHDGTANPRPRCVTSPSGLPSSSASPSPRATSTSPPGASHSISLCPASPRRRQALQYSFLALSASCQHFQKTKFFHFLKPNKLHQNPQRANPPCYQLYSEEVVQTDMRMHKV